MITSRVASRRVAWGILPLIAVLWCLAGMAKAAQPSDFYGQYSGSAELVMSDGRTVQRDMSVRIEPAEDGFSVLWSSTSQRADGTQRTKTYDVEFRPGERPGLYAAAMERNVFGHEVQLDPMKGEPYVWARIEGDTMSVFSLFINASGGYDIQQFDRTLVDGGLNLEFRRFEEGAAQRTISAFLKRDGS